ncbi:MAG: DsbA family protein [Candidatus Limnocylindrales bacterium]
MRRDSEPGSPRERRRDRRIAERQAERERARNRPARPAWRSPTALVTIGAVVIGILALAVVIAFTGSTGGSNPASAASLIKPPNTIPAGLENDRTLGRPDAPVTVDLWTDFQCPYCAQFTQQIEPQLIRDFVVPGTVKLVAHDLSFIGAGHTPDESNDAAVAARCAARQGRFWEYDEYLFWNQLGENVGSFTPPRLLAIASAVGLDTTAFTSCVADPSVLAAVTADTAAGTAKGVTSTPTLFVNGTRLVGVPSYASLAATIRAAAGATSPASPTAPANSSSSSSPSVSSAP